MALSILGLSAVAFIASGPPSVETGRRNVSVVDLIWAVIAVYTIGYIGLAILHPELLW